MERLFTQDVTLPAVERLECLLFGETQGRIVISVAAGDAARVLEMTAAEGVDAARIGTAGGTELRIQLGARSFAWSAAELHDLWWNSIARLMK